MAPSRRAAPPVEYLKNPVNYRLKTKIQKKKSREEIHFWRKDFFFHVSLCDLLLRRANWTTRRQMAFSFHRKTLFTHRRILSAATVIILTIIILNGHDNKWIVCVISSLRGRHTEAAATKRIFEDFSTAAIT